MSTPEKKNITITATLNGKSIENLEIDTVQIGNTDYYNQKKKINKLASILSLTEEPSFTPNPIHGISPSPAPAPAPISPETVLPLRSGGANLRKTNRRKKRSRKKSAKNNNYFK